jgi:hypothetical protein
MEDRIEFSEDGGWRIENGMIAAVTVPSSTFHLPSSPIF